MITMAPPRTTELHGCQVRLPAEPATAGVARDHVRVVLAAWDVPVDADIAVLLASDLVTNAIRHQADGTITLVITGAFFIAINLFIVVALVRYRHRSGHRAAYEPHNRKLEWWLIGLTIVGVAALLAPGLFVYADYIRPPRNVLQMELLGQQWQWRFRFAGPGGKLAGPFPAATRPMLSPNVRHPRRDQPMCAQPAAGHRYEHRARFHTYSRRGRARQLGRPRAGGHTYPRCCRDRQHSQPGSTGSQ